MKNLYITVAVIIGLTVGIVWFSQVKADYMLVMTKVDTRMQFGQEVFIGYFDCRERGLANQQMLKIFTEDRIGFSCPTLEEYYE